jgi:hypothetical protein
MIGETWRAQAAGALLGASKSEMIPDTLYLGFLDENGDEPPEYERTPVATTGAVWSTTGGGVANTVVIDAGEAGEGWPELAQWALWDAPTAGNPVIVGDLDTPVTPSDGEALQIPIGGLVVEVA